ncbi:oxysterol-binding 4B-like protein [Perilla frutescens var. hirtella]|nr:oxysterol-binding 4B-like protein [Perilla frutescens var. hirtella]
MALIKSSSDDDDDQKAVSVLQGDGVCMSRILGRESSSVGKTSSRIFYRSGEGVPFRWEMQPGTAKNPREDEDVIPPICPSPLMQSIGLPLPNLDHDEGDFKRSKKMRRRLREMVNKGMSSCDIIKKVAVDIISGRRSKHQPESSSRRVLDVSMVDGPFCCSPWNIPAILDEGNRRVYYCSQHKNAFAVEEDDIFLSRLILSGVSSAEQFSDEISPAGIPFGWEMHPGTPKESPEKEVIPPPSPPPAVQSLSLPPAGGAGSRDTAKKSTWKNAWFWIRRCGKKKENNKIMISFRYHGKMDEELDASFRKSSSRNLQLRGKFFSCGPWNTYRRDFLFFAKKKLNIHL